MNIPIDLIRLKRIVVLLILFGLWGSAPLAADSFEGEQKPIGGILERGTRVIGMGAGFAFGTTDFGGWVHHDALVFQVHYAVVVSDLLAEGRFFSGHLELGGEFLLQHQVRPDSGVLFGATPMARYVFEGAGRWKPFVEGGIGFALTDIGAPSLSGTLQFNQQAGLGFFWFLDRDAAVTVQQRIIHYSNAGLRFPNIGLNQHVILVGLTRFY